MAIVGYFFLVPFPDDRPDKCWGFLNEREVAFVIARVEKDRADTTTEPFSLVKFLQPGLDPKVWGFALIFCCLTTVTYALAFFLPIILREGMTIEYIILVQRADFSRNGLQRGRCTMSRDTSLRLCRHRDVHHRLDWRQGIARGPPQAYLSDDF